jgi:hypothetical protein
MSRFRNKLKDDLLRCSFCGRGQDAVSKLIAGPAVYICNECIDICNEIIADDQRIKTPPASHENSEPPKVMVVAVFECSFCKTPTPLTECVSIPERGKLCPACLDATRSVIEGLDRGKHSQ